MDKIRNYNDNCPLDRIEKALKQLVQTQQKICFFQRGSQNGRTDGWADGIMEGLMDGRTGELTDKHG